MVLPAEVAARLPKGQLLLEHEWRELGVQQSRGWLHYRCGKALLACVWHRNTSLNLCGPHGEVGIGANILKTWSMCVHASLSEILKFKLYLDLRRHISARGQQIHASHSIRSPLHSALVLLLCPRHVVVSNVSQSANMLPSGPFPFLTEVAPGVEGAMGLGI